MYLQTLNFLVVQLLLYIQVKCKIFQNVSKNILNDMNTDVFSSASDSRLTPHQSAGNQDRSAEILKNRTSLQMSAANTESKNTINDSQASIVKSNDSNSATESFALSLEYAESEHRNQNEDIGSNNVTTDSSSNLDDADHTNSRSSLPEQHISEESIIAPATSSTASIEVHNTPSERQSSHPNDSASNLENRTSVTPSADPLAGGEGQHDISQVEFQIILTAVNDGETDDEENVEEEDHNHSQESNNEN